jgi:Leucine Rich repeats (2 copies)
VPTKQQEDAFLEALADCEKQKLRFIEIHNDLLFAQDHPDYFDDLPALEQLKSGAEAYLAALNAVIAHECRLSKGEIVPPQLFDPARANPPIDLPVIILKKKNIGKTIKEWYMIKDDGAITSEEKGLINCISGQAIPQISNFTNIRDPHDDPAKTLELQAEAVASVVNAMDRIGIRSQPDLTKLAELPTMLPFLLKKLWMEDNPKLNVLDGIEHFSQLETLVLRKGQVTDLAPLGSCQKLSHLDISRNNISDLSALRQPEEARDRR